MVLLCQGGARLLLLGDKFASDAAAEKSHVWQRRAAATTHPDTTNDCTICSHLRVTANDFNTKSKLQLI